MAVETFSTDIMSLKGQMAVETFSTDIMSLKGQMAAEPVEAFSTDIISLKVQMAAEALMSFLFHDIFKYQIVFCGKQVFIISRELVECL